MVQVRPDDVDVLESYVRATIGTSPAAWPGGWEQQIEAALLDAVLSVRARYGRRTPGRETGVYGAVVRWIRYRGGVADDLSVLAGTQVDLLRSITNSGKLAGRYKAEVVIDAAVAFVSAGIVHAADFSDRQVEARAAYLAVHGCGPVTWSYLRMLLGQDDVKADTWVMRFVRDRLPHVSTAAEAKTLVSAVSDRLGVDAKQLDHAVWQYRREAHTEEETNR